MKAIYMVETERAQSTFYPTPAALIAKMMDGIAMDKVGSVLEPSAGKGDIAEAIANRLQAKYWRSGDEAKRMIDCVEIDPNLRAILKDKGFRVVHDDFLSFQTFKKYDLIVMNPPFDQGDKHLLKAIELLRGSGGQVVCILNAETIRNPYSYTRKQLLKVIDEMEGTVEDCGKAFVAAERKTAVDAVIVRVNVPAPEKKSSILDEMRRAYDERKQDEPETPYNALAKGDFIEAIVDRYNYEVMCGMRLIDEWNAMKPMLAKSIDESESKVSDPILSLAIGREIHRGGDDATHNRYIKLVRKKYWSYIFQQPQFVSQLTSNLRNELYDMVDELVDYDFSFYNIYTIAQHMLSKVNTGIEQTIMKLFNDWTYKHSWRDDNSPNRHYFDGWCTNDAFAVNKKVIFPFYGAIDHWDGKLDAWKVTSKIGDIEKVFDFLDGGRSIGADSTAMLKEAAAAGITKNIQCKYFTVTFYKKGTCHVVFTNLDVLHKFNLFAAQGKNWLPPCYGRKRYKEMTPEEKAVIDSFEGEKSYERVMQRADYFLQTSQPMMLLGEGGASNA